MIGKIMILFLIGLWVWLANEFRKAPLVTDVDGFNPNDKHDFVD